MRIMRSERWRPSLASLMANDRSGDASIRRFRNLVSNTTTDLPSNAVVPAH